MPRSIQFVAILGAAALALTAAAAVAQPTVRLRIIAKIGDPAPLFGAGQIVESLGTPSAGDDGLMSYTVWTDSGGGLVVGNPALEGSLRLAIREQGIPNTAFTINVVMEHHPLDGGGFAAIGLLSGNLLPAGASGAIVDTGSGPVLVAFAGMGYVGDGSILSNISAYRVNAGGSVLFAGTLGGPGIEAASNRVVMRADQTPSGVFRSTVLRSGLPVADGVAGVVTEFDTEAIAINAAGLALVPVSLQRADWAEPRTVLVMQPPGAAAAQILAPGDIITHPDGDLVITSILASSLNDSGSIAFTAFADRSSGGVSGLPVIGRITSPLGPGRVAVADAVGGDMIANTAPNSSFAGLYSVWSLTESRTITSGTVTGPGVGTGNDTMLASAAPGLTSLLREGDPAPGLPAGVTIAYLSGTIAISPDGYTAIAADLVEPEFQQATRYALFLISPSGVTTPVVRLGQMIELAPGDARPLRGFMYNPRSNGQDGRSRAVARGGRFDFRAEFDGGMTAVIEAVPAGCNAADLASLGGVLAPDGRLTADDVVGFLGAFFSGDALADLASLGGAPAPDGELTADDVVAFLAAFFAGCT